MTLFNEASQYEPGEVVLIDGSEASPLKGFRPCVVTAQIPLGYVVVPLSSTAYLTPRPTDISFLPSSTNGIPVKSTVLCHHSFEVLDSKIAKPLGVLSPKEWQAVQAGLLAAQSHEMSKGLAKVQ